MGIGSEQYSLSQGNPQAGASSQGGITSRDLLDALSKQIGGLPMAQLDRLRNKDKFKPESLIAFNSCIELRGGKLVLKGDDKLRMAGSVYCKDGGGNLGWKKIVDLLNGVDPRNEGVSIGDSLSTDAEAQNDERMIGGEGAFSVSLVTRVFTEKLYDEDDPTQMTETLYMCFRTVHFTGAGRAFAVSKETMLPLCYVGGGGGGGKEYKAGDYTNIVFTEDETDNKIKIDVFYK